MATSTFRFLFEDDHSTDVTLVCEDNQQIWVHKVILSSVSEFSNAIFPEELSPTAFDLSESQTHRASFLGQVHIHGSVQGGAEGLGELLEHDKGTQG